MNCLQKPDVKAPNGDCWCVVCEATRLSEATISALGEVAIEEERGTLHIESAGLVNTESPTLAITAFKQNATMTVRLNEQRAFDIGCQLLAWCQRKKAARHT